MSDLKSYTFSDNDVELAEWYPSEVQLIVSAGWQGSVYVKISKGDAISLAKHFNITPEDLESTES